MIISAGSDTYGRVKTISGTPIVTKFAMLQFLPVYPLRSFYLVRRGPTEFEGIPLVAGTRSTTIVGIPLASLDVASVLVAYLRGLFGTVVVLGFILLFIPAFLYLIGDHAPGLPTSFLRWVFVLFLGGVLGGSLSYLIPFTNRRERDIRRHCCEVLGIAADPARVTPESISKLAERVAHLGSSPNPAKTALVGELIKARINIAQGVERDQMERKTDELLNQLKFLEPSEEAGSQK